MIPREGELYRAVRRGVVYAVIPLTFGRGRIVQLTEDDSAIDDAW